MKTETEIKKTIKALEQELSDAVNNFDFVNAAQIFQNIAALSWVNGVHWHVEISYKVDNVIKDNTIMEA